MKKNGKILFLITTLILLTALIVSNTVFKKGTYSQTNYYLDTVNEVSLINIRKKQADKLLPEVDKIILDINNEMSLQLPGSELSKINKNAGIKAVKVSDDIFNVIEKSVYYSKLTNGEFDIAVGPLTSLWNIGNKNARVPSESEIKNVLPLVNYKNIVLNKAERTVYLKEKGMKLDLGGIAKGFCADKIASYLKNNGVKDAIINLGGNIYVLGKNDRNKDFSVGIQDPAKDSSSPMANIKVSNKSVVTSGIYERYLEKDGKIYHHMLNPKTGYPFDNNLNSVTIVSDKSIDGDALSTSIYGLGLKEGFEKIKSIKGVDAIFITKDSKVYITDGLKNNFELLNNKYHLVN